MADNFNLEKGGVKDDKEKLRFDLIPVRPLLEEAWVFTTGCRKYDDRNWEKGMRWGRVFSALMRHSWKWFWGEKFDRECQNPNCKELLPKAAAQDAYFPCQHCGSVIRRFHHLAAVAWCAHVLMEYELTRTEFDDRPKSEGDLEW